MAAIKIGRPVPSAPATTAGMKTFKVACEHLGQKMVYPLTPTQTPAPPWSRVCKAGQDRLVHDMKKTSDWKVFLSSSAAKHTVATLAAGCPGPALRLSWDLTKASATGERWVVLRLELPKPEDWSKYTHLRLALRGKLAQEMVLDVKVDDGKLHMVSRNSVLDIPHWRELNYDLVQFDMDKGPVNWKQIKAVEIAVACPAWGSCTKRDIAGNHAPTVEFSSQAAVSGIRDANYVITHNLALLDKGHLGVYPIATDTFWGGNPSSWNETWTGLAPSGWMYFALGNLRVLESICTK